MQMSQWVTFLLQQLSCISVLMPFRNFSDIFESHEYLAYFLNFEMLKKVRIKFSDCQSRLNISPQADIDQKRFFFASQYCLNETKRRDGLSGASNV